MKAISEEKSVGIGVADTVAFCVVFANVLSTVVSTVLFSNERRG